MTLDIAVATRLHRLIEHYRVPSEYAAAYEGRRLGYVFRDRDELPVSSDLSANIQEALDHSRFLIVVCTPDTPASIWVEREIRYFLKNHDQDHVLAVLADGTPQAAFPEPLVHEYDDAGNVTGNIEPLAANIADPASNKRRVLKNLDREAIRLFAALIGCPYDALYQRERRYRTRRLAAAGGVALAVAVAYIAMLSVKNGQITRQNAELIEQKRRIQLSQSQLLAQDAERALEAGDYVAAMRNSVDALPVDAEDARPYCAPAERALLATTDVFNNSSVFKNYQRLIDARTVELASPVREAVFDSTGTWLCAMDDYGNLSKIDAFTGETTWRTLALEHIQGRPSYLKFFLHETKGCLLVSSRDEVACLDLEDGSALWRYEKYYSPIEMFALDEQNDLIAFIDCVDSRRKDGMTLYDFDLVVLRASTGEPHCRANLQQDVSNLTLAGAINFDAEAIQNGLFYNDGRAFAGFYCDYYRENVTFFSADLEQGECRLLRNDPSDYDTSVFHLDAVPDGTALIALQRGGRNAAARIRIISLENGDILAEGTTGEEAEEDFIDPPPPHVFYRGTLILLSVGKHLYALDPQTCECIAAAPLTDALTSMEQVDDTVFAFTLADGYYSLGWIGGGIFRDSNALGLAFDIGANSGSSLGAGGIMKPRVADNKFQGIMCGSPKEGYGYVSVIPDDNSHQIKLLRLLPGLELPAWEGLDFPEEDCHIESFANTPGMRMYDGKAMLIERSLNDESGFDYQIALMDMQTRTIIRRINTQRNLTRDLWPFSDVEGIFEIISYHGEINRIDPFGEEPELIASGNEVVLSVYEDIGYVDSDAYAAAGYLEGSGLLLTAWCDGAQLRWWLDGEEQTPVSLPEDVVWQIAQPTRYRRLLSVAPGGMILFSDFGESTDEDAMAAIVAYDTALDCWYRVEDAARGSADRAFAAGCGSGRVATLDADGGLRVYDVKAGELLTTLPLNLPQSYVTRIQFALDDACLLLRTADDQLSIYDLESGECVYRGALKQGYDPHLQAWMDSRGERVIVIDAGSGDGVALKASDWSELARLEDAYCFDPATDELYSTVLVGDSIYPKLFRHRIPDIWELTESVRNTLDG